MSKTTSFKTKLILASASPRRRDILNQAGLNFDVIPSNIGEDRRPHEPPKTYVKRLACEKAMHIKSADGNYCLGADTIVVLGTQILGKPENAQEAFSHLKKLNGNTHKVLTGFCLLKIPGQIIVNDFEESLVTFRRMTDDEIKTYIQTGEPMDKAGAYALQGAGEKFIERVLGLHSNVIGLPIEKLVPFFKKEGLL